jgi:hypothetical protein
MHLALYSKIEHRSRGIAVSVVLTVEHHGLEKLEENAG